MDRSNVALNSLHSAMFYYKNDNYGRAFAHFLLIFELDASFCKMYRDEFVYTLREWGLELERKQRSNDVCKCYLDGIRYFPADMDIMKYYSVHLIKMDSVDNGDRYAQFASTTSEQGLLFEKLMQSVNLDLVSRWHFRMVNDYERNMAYYKSLLSFGSEKPVKVLDIGSGSGLLSLFASNSPNVNEIYAIESEDVLAAVAKNVFRDNYTKNVQVINRRSTALSSEDINGRADLLVTEIFDAGLFGEHSLMTLKHAWEELLNKDAKIIPHSADIFITGIQSEEISRKYRVVQQIDLLKDVVIIYKHNEPYGAENLKILEWKPITETVKILTVDFCSPSQLRSLLDEEKVPVNLRCISNGEIDAYVLWFNLHLDDCITITTNPNIDNVKCWEQAIFSADFPQSYQIGDQINLNFSCIQNCATLDYLGNKVIPEHFRVTQEVITYLNDTLITNMMGTLANKCCESSLTILDCNIFPLFGLLLAKSGGKCHYIYQDNYHTCLVNHTITINNIPKENIVEKTVDNLINQMSREDFSSYDVVFFDVIAINGTLDADMYTLLRDCSSSQVPGQDVYPKAVKLVCEVIESDYLPHCSRANDDNSFAFKIANHLNKFAIQEYWMVDKTLPHRKLTSKLKLDILRDDSQPLFSEHLLPVIQKGKTHGVLYWFELCYGENLKISTLESSHYNIACFLLHKNDIVYENNYVKLSVKQHGGFLKIFFNC